MLSAIQKLTVLIGAASLWSCREDGVNLTSLASLPTTSSLTMTQQRFDGLADDFRQARSFSWSLFTQLNRIGAGRDADPEWMSWTSVETLLSSAKIVAANSKTFKARIESKEAEFYTEPEIAEILDQSFKIESTAAAGLKPNMFIAVGANGLPADSASGLALTGSIRTTKTPLASNSTGIIFFNRTYAESILRAIGNNMVDCRNTNLDSPSRCIKFKIGSVAVKSRWQNTTDVDSVLAYDTSEAGLASAFSGPAAVDFKLKGSVSSKDISSAFRRQAPAPYTGGRADLTFLLLGQHVAIKATDSKWIYQTIWLETAQNARNLDFGHDRPKSWTGTPWESYKMCTIFRDRASSKYDKQDPAAVGMIALNNAVKPKTAASWCADPYIETPNAKSSCIGCHSHLMQKMQQEVFDYPPYPENFADGAATPIFIAQGILGNYIKRSNGRGLVP